MKKKIIVESHGIVHAIAFCDDCDWREALDFDKIISPRDLRNKINQHVRKTGHSVSLEVAKITRYKGG